MNFQPDRQNFAALARATIAAVALVLLPMGVPAGQPTLLAKEPTAAKHKKIDPKSPPSYTSTPKSDATDVDPALKEIVLKFDRDMEGGMSWTGGPPDFPPVDENREAQWRDKRTCVLPVMLKKGAYYRVGVNSTSFQNFRSESGVPADPGAIYFTTVGAKPALVRRVKAPKVVEAEPALDADNVDPATKFLRVTFDMPMGGGMSWTGKVPVAEGQKARWLRDARTCLMPVALEPGKTYAIGLNSPSHINFQSKWGVPLEPVVYKFKTAAASDGKKSDN